MINTYITIDYIGFQTYQYLTRIIKRAGYCVLLGILLFACKAKVAVVDTPIIEEEKYVFPEKKISEALKSSLNISEDSALMTLYKADDFKPLWKNDTLIKEGIAWLKESRFHGLSPNDYSIKELDSCFSILNIDSSQYIHRYAKLDLLLTSSVKSCGERIRFSNLNPKDFHSGWNFPKPEKQTSDSVWVRMIKQGNVEGLNQYFQPDSKLYTQLKVSLKKYLLQDSLLSDKPINNPGFFLQYGDSNKYVLPIKRKLLKIHPDSSTTMTFNDELRKAVIDLQLMHGLSPDGIVGRQTYYFLNWDNQRYIDAIKVNMERLRWLPNSILKNGMLVNIPSQKAHLIHQDSLVFSSRVIVGKFKNKTRVFHSNIDYLVFNPCWTVPKSIVTTTILRGLKRDSAYLQKRNMFLSDNGTRVINDSLDFTAYTASNFPYQVFQNAAPNNALGKVKFMFKNRYSIYLHDTPQKSLFRKDVRSYSHGCVRVQNALQLAETMLGSVDHQGTPIQKHLSKGYPEKVYLNKTIPISILYLTCWLNNEKDQLIFDRDIYAFDYKVLQKLK